MSTVSRSQKRDRILRDLDARDARSALLPEEQDGLDLDEELSPPTP
jgi:hypothetical protein